ncbi:MAG: glycine cleavage system protein GcvH [Clostridia bacterium]|nr:glycine cleavage system protein GcvH [Clostridia bacterium]
MNYPQELKYTRTHEWVRFTGENMAYIGITDYAQDQLGDLVFVNLPQEGDELTAGTSFSDVESVKAVSDVNSPVTGKVLKVNEALADAPEKMNETPYEAWFVLAGEITETEDLMDAEAYEAFTASEG